MAATTMLRRWQAKNPTKIHPPPFLQHKLKPHFSISLSFSKCESCYIVLVVYYNHFTFFFTFTISFLFYLCPIHQPAKSNQNCKDENHLLCEKSRHKYSNTKSIDIMLNALITCSVFTFTFVTNSVNQGLSLLLKKRPSFD